MSEFIRGLLTLSLLICVIIVYLEAVKLRDKNRVLTTENDQLRYNLLQFKVKHGYNVSED